MLDEEVEDEAAEEDHLSLPAPSRTSCASTEHIRRNQASSANEAISAWHAEAHER